MDIIFVIQISSLVLFGTPFLCVMDLVHITQNKTIDYNHSMSETDLQRKFL